MANLFVESKNAFKWKNIKPFLVRNQYNELLNFVVDAYYSKQYPTNVPNFLNKNHCLTLANFNSKCKCGHNDLESNSILSKVNSHTLAADEKDLENYKAQFKIDQRNLDLAFANLRQSPINKSTKEIDELKKLEDAIENKEEVSKTYTSVSTALKTNTSLQSELNELKALVDTYEKSLDVYKTQEIKMVNKGNEKNLKDQKAMVDYQNALAKYEMDKRNFDYNPTSENEENQAASKKNFEEVETTYKKNISSRVAMSDENDCRDMENEHFCTPLFEYQRTTSLTQLPTGSTFNLNDLKYGTTGLTVGAVVWLYYYERMGIFKILGVLMDDYNYKGKYTISGSRADKNGNINSYSTLMDLICNLYRAGIGSNLRDRVCTYQRVLGVTIENNLGIESEQNTGFMQTFNKLIGYMLEYYKTKQLAQAIQSQNGLTQPRSSVATQTSIRDTMNLLKQQFEPIEYGRSQMNIFLGISTVHATLCLVNMLRKEIGIPDQYESPEEFIPAAYDILVAKKTPTLNETNRYIVHDNCASYGYRLLTDIETASLNDFSIVASGSTLDIWLNDIEGVVEGYNNAYASVLEPASAML